MELRVRLDGDVFADLLPEIADDGAFLFLQRARDVGVDAEEQAVAVQILGDLPDLAENLIADRRARLDDARAGAVRARLGEHALEALFDPLARDDDQAEIR